MGSLHNVTQLSPFVLSGDGAFLPISEGCQQFVEDMLREHASNPNRLLRVPAEIQHAAGSLNIHGMHTVARELPSEKAGAFLYVESGGKHGYGSELTAFIELTSKHLGDFRFFVLWNNEYAYEYFQSDGKLVISRVEVLPAGNEEDFFVSRLQQTPSLLRSYLLESGLWARRWYESELAENGQAATEIIVDQFPDAIQTIRKALELHPDDPQTRAVLEWYNQHLPQSNI